MDDMADTKIHHVEGGRVEVWLRKDGIYGVSLLPDEGDPDYPGQGSFTSTEGIDGFPGEYDEQALKAWGRERWRDERPR